MNEKISIIIPTLDEEKNIYGVLKTVSPKADEIIIVDGYSADKTVEIAKKFKTKIVFDRKGKGSALRKGIKLAKGNIVIMMDADDSHQAKEIPLLVEAIRAGYDACLGSRFIQGGGTGDMPFVRKIGNKFFVFLVNSFWHTNYSDLCYGYRGFSKKALKKLSLKCNGFGIESEISIQCAKKGLKVIEFPSYEKPRKSGQGKLRTFRDGYLILKTIIRELFSVQQIN